LCVIDNQSLLETSDTKNCRQIIRTGKDVQAYGHGRLSCISQSVCTTTNTPLQTQHTIHFKCLRQTTAKSDCQLPPRLPVSVSPAIVQIASR